MSDKIRPWQAKKPKRFGKKIVPLRTGSSQKIVGLRAGHDSRIVPLRASDYQDWKEDEDSQ